MTMNRHQYVALYVLLWQLLLFQPVSSNFISNLISQIGGDNQQQRQGEISGSDLITVEDGALMAILSNDKTIPLVGLGVGTLQNYMVPLMVAGAFQQDKKTRLIETAHVADNEHLVAQGISQGVRRLEGEEKITIHVITKVWYTHLGYERTKLSVQQSLANLQEAFDLERVDLRVHVMLHWPRCYANIPWMNCEEDEENLSDDVRMAGPAPHLDRHAWKGSWRYLEEAYLSKQFPIDSIGVSNFHLGDLEEMDKMTKVPPHILQINIWSLLYDPLLVDYCHKNNVHIQVYNIMNGIMDDPDKAPNAYHHLQKVAADLSEDSNEEVTPGQVVLAWLIQHGVSVAPRTSRLSRLKENSAVSLSKIAEFTDAQVETVAHIVEAFLSAQDLEEDINVKITFHATNKDTFLYWNRHDGGEVKVAFIKHGESFNETTYPNHSFRLYDASNKDHFIEYKVEAKFGEHHHVHAEL